MTAPTGHFDHVAMGPTDPMFDLKIRLDSDSSLEKIDLGAGVYRDEMGAYYELPAVKKAKLLLNKQNPGHDIASVQTISGTGANHLGAVFAKKFLLKSSGLVYIGTPAWGNYKPIFEHAGFKAVSYQYYNDKEKAVDFDNVLKTMRSAPKNSIFVHQGCCHNPSGMDFSEAQWKELAIEMRRLEHFPILDIAYQGFGHDIEKDAFGIRLFVQEKFEMMVCQSFSKNMGLYGERVGAFHVVVNDKNVAIRVVDQLRCIIRWEFSSSPAYGARLVTHILGSDALESFWKQDVEQMRARLLYNRQELFALLTETYKTPMNWQHILQESGLFSLLDLSPSQVKRLEQEFHIFLSSSGRINVAGLNPSNLNAVARALDIVIRDGLQEK